MDGTQEAVSGVTTRRAGAGVEGPIPAEGPRVDDTVHTRTGTRRHLRFFACGLHLNQRVGSRLAPYFREDGNCRNYRASFIHRNKGRVGKFEVQVQTTISRWRFSHSSFDVTFVFV